jgi:hypothetical protein
MDAQARVIEGVRELVAFGQGLDRAETLTDPRSGDPRSPGPEVEAKLREQTIVAQRDLTEPHGTTT